MKTTTPLFLLFTVVGIFVSTLHLSAQYKQTIVNKTILVQNKGNIIPLQRLDKLKIAVVTPVKGKYNTFTEQLQKYAEVGVFDFNMYEENTKYFNMIIVAATERELRSDLAALLQQSVVNRKHVILCLFSESGSLESPWAAANSQSGFTKLVSPSFDAISQRNAALSIFGGLALTEGKLKTEQTRIQYTAGESSGLNISKMTTRIDAIAKEAISKHAAPGLVVMALKSGQVIFEKAYGSHTYESKQVTAVDDIFDLASISKIAGTTPVIMTLQEQGIIHLDSTIGHYLGQAKTTNKADITTRSVLLHEAGFTPFIPFYRNLKPGDLQSHEDAEHQVKVADNAFLKNNYYQNVMWPEMLNSAVKPTGNYVYSDISMYVMKEIAEHETSTPMEEFVQDFLYKPIGMKTAGYTPRTRFDRSRIVPTQHDTAFRKVLLQGYVHDEGAAMAGGVAGHAGLFATANDLAIYGQLLLNRGEYGGVRYFKPETVDLFTSNQSQSSRRGLGFDRADPDLKKEYPSKFANSSVYGHTGYTGTCIWIDPKHQLVYIFLSNRVHPQVTGKLYELNIRSRIQDVIYETINEAK
ncbi:beta-lactamase family protein [Sphingobacterium olei]|uniref:Beta-lactamase family protein n=1 Tax=Sphingobacterium olei TaxID=2571155 RepID=A0A4U0PB00_9SPHI|nr:serine hydrolase domain-containing protein [Sphingobacterium olei]TJZ59844.1 beta-lactamase family protein [Sphingobacterium olei]